MDGDRGRMASARHELPFGAELVGDRVRFRLWAPRASAVSLLLEGADRGELAMQAEPGGWFSLTTDRAGAGTRYRYVVDGMAVPDPASRFQPDGVHGASEVIDPNAYRWQDTGWPGRAWEEFVIYELHLGTFSPSGDFAGAVGRLDYLRQLGITAVELMPIGEFAGCRNWGYDGVQFYAPASCYGRPEDLKALVDACHARGLAVLLDVVYNHFGPRVITCPPSRPISLLSGITRPGARRSIMTGRAAVRCATSSFRTRFIGSRNFGSTGCGSTPFTPLPTTAPLTSSSNWLKQFAAGSPTARST